MISYKLHTPERDIPVFAGEEVLQRAGELLELYRFAGPVVVIFRRKNAEFLRQTSPVGEKAGAVIEFSDTHSFWDFHALARVWDQIPWKAIRKAREGVLFAYGDERVLALASAAGLSWSVSRKLILVPQDAWTFVSGAVAPEVGFAWRDVPGLFRIPVAADMLLLPTAEWQKKTASPLLDLAGILRSYFMAPAEAFTRFGERWFRPVLEGATPGTAWISDFLEDWQEGLQSGRVEPEWLRLFGIKLVRAIEVEQRKRIQDRLRALLIWFELMWSWQLAAELLIAPGELAESMVRLIQEFMRRFGVKEQEWEQIQATALAKRIPALTQDVFLPRELGRLQRWTVVDAAAAERAVKRCAL